MDEERSPSTLFIVLPNTPQPRDIKGIKTRCLTAFHCMEDVENWKDTTTTDDWWCYRTLLARYVRADSGMPLEEAPIGTGPAEAWMIFDLSNAAGAATLILQRELTTKVELFLCSEESRIYVTDASGRSIQTRFIHFQLRQTAIPHKDLVQLMVNKVWTAIVPRVRENPNED